MNFDFTVLGSSAAAPTKSRNPSSFVINHNKKYFLIDCGEGTQMQFLKYGINAQKVNHIFISHLHGDHFFGLIGLLSTLHLTGRTKDLHLFCPKELKEVIESQLKVSDTTLRFNIVYHYHTYEDIHLIWENSVLEIYSFPLQHGVPCCGFLFKEKPRAIKINKEKLPKDFSIEQISQLLEGNDIIDDQGQVIYKNEELTLPPIPPKSFAYCSDTRVFEKETDYIKNVDLLYHETTFLDNMSERAAQTHHSTAYQVGLLAKKAKVMRLIIGHFSARYKNLSTFSSEIAINF